MAGLLGLIRASLPVASRFFHIAPVCGLTGIVSEMSDHAPYVGRMKPLLLLLLAGLATPVLASDDHDAARSALEAQQVRPLAEIAAQAEQRLNGRMIDAELEKKHGIYVYELELITDSGRLIEVKVDAATGDILEVEQEGWSAGKSD